MKLKSIGIIFKSLNDAGVKYLLAGGLAVVAHGYVRFTADVDIILGMDERNLMSAMKVFDSLGYKPRAPVKLDDFVDTEKRFEWISKKGLTVFSLWNPDEPATEVDIFVEPPIDFDKAYSAGVNCNIVNEIYVKVLSLNDLMFTKRKAGRQKDLDDIVNLAIINEEKMND
jgi:predicted nucleotidyltransferase